jgi:exonuclease III
VSVRLARSELVRAATVLGFVARAEIMERMNALGFYDCLRMFKGKLTPTFRNPSGGMVIHQLDHLYVTPMLLSRFARCDVGSTERVLEPSPMLSDHLPIVADFNWPE